MNEAMLGVADVARYMAVCPKTVMTLASRGLIPHVRVGRQIRFRREALIAWAQEQEAAGREAQVNVG